LKIRKEMRVVDQLFGRPLPSLGVWAPFLSPVPPRRLPVTCLGAGNGKPEGARRVQFAMGLFGKTQEKPPKELRFCEWLVPCRRAQK